MARKLKSALKMVKEKFNSSTRGAFVNIFVMTDEELTAFGRRIQMLRERQRMSQEDLAKAYSELAVKYGGHPARTAQAIHKWENWKRGEKKRWPESEIRALYEALGTNRDILMTGKNDFTNEGISFVELKAEAAHKFYPLYPLSKIESETSGAPMGGEVSILSKSTNYPFQEKGLCFNMPDDSMEPRIEKGSFIFLRLGICPNPGDFVVLKIKSSGLRLFRKFVETPEAVNFEPLNPDWSSRRLSYSKDKWQDSVEIAGVASSFETPLRID